MPKSQKLMLLLVCFIVAIQADFLTLRFPPAFSFQGETADKGRTHGSINRETFQAVQFLSNQTHSSQLDCLRDMTTYSFCNQNNDGLAQVYSLPDRPCTAIYTRGPLENSCQYGSSYGSCKELWTSSINYPLSDLLQVAPCVNLAVPFDIVSRSGDSVDVFQDTGSTKSCSHKQVTMVLKQKQTSGEGIYYLPSNVTVVQDSKPSWPPGSCNSLGSTRRSLYTPSFSAPSSEQYLHSLAQACPLLPSPPSKPAGVLYGWSTSSASSRPVNSIYAVGSSNSLVWASESTGIQDLTFFETQGSGWYVAGSAGFPNRVFRWGLISRTGPASLFSTDTLGEVLSTFRLPNQEPLFTLSYARGGWTLSRLDTSSNATSTITLLPINARKLFTKVFSSPSGDTLYIPTGKTIYIVDTASWTIKGTAPVDLGLAFHNPSYAVAQGTLYGLRGDTCGCQFIDISLASGKGASDRNGTPVFGKLGLCREIPCGLSDNGILSCVGQNKLMHRDIATGAIKIEPYEGQEKIYWVTY